MNKDIHIDLPVGQSIKSIALDQMCEGLRGLGVSDSDIAKARAEAERTNDDKPLMKLMKLRMFR